MDNDSMSLYMSDVTMDLEENRHLTCDEEIALAKIIEPMVKLENRGGPYSDEEEIAIRKGKAAESRLITANALLVVKMAKPWHGADGLDYTDLIQEGNLGLMKAARRYDWRRGNKFSTYATWWIRQAVSRAVADQSRVIRVPVHMSDRIRKLRAVGDRLAQGLGRRPSIEELASEVGLSEAKTKEVLSYTVTTGTISIDEDRGKDKETDFYQFLPDNAPPVECTPEQSDLSEAVNQVLSTLDARSQRIIEMRLGLNGYGGQEHTLEEVGRNLGLTRERVRQIEAEALRRLRHPRRARLVKDFLE